MMVLLRTQLFYVSNDRSPNFMFVSALPRKQQTALFSMNSLFSVTKQKTSTATLQKNKPTTFSQPPKITSFSTTKKRTTTRTSLKFNKTVATTRLTPKSTATTINRPKVTPTKKSFKPTTRTSSLPRTLTTSPPKHVVCLKLMGRLGNLMFQYAAAYGIARSKNMDVVISENEHITNIFHLDRGGRVVKNTSMCRGVKTKSEIRASAFDKETLNFHNDKNIALFGYLQSYKYFEKVSDEIRRQFAFRDPIKTKAKKALHGILQNHLEKHVNETRNWTFVAVHVRRGDMVNHPHGYMVAPKEYFQRTRNMFRALYQSVIFVMCSDDINWCKNNLKSDDTYFVTGNTPEVDMAILSSCNHTISSVGSFSWWSAWLGNGLVTYYSPPARPGSGLRRAYSKDYSDFFLPKWIKVS